jgi:lysophospholipase L1-like esterase
MTKPSLARQLTLGFAVLAMIGGGAEAGARLDDYWRLGIPLLAAPGYDDLITQDSLGGHGRPNGRYRDIRLNSGGFRSPESALAHTPGCVTVMTLGASETLGTGSGAPGNEYPAQLGDSLSTHGCYHVLNAGIVGISLPSLIPFWRSWGSRYHPDVVVVLTSPSLYLGEAPPRRPAQTPPKPAPAPPPARASLHLESRLFERVHTVIHYPDFIQEQRVQNHLRVLTAGRHSDWYFSSIPWDRLASYREDLDSLLASIRAAGVQPVLVAYPMRFGRALSVGDSALMAAWREFSPRTLPQAQLDFMWAARDTLLDLARRRNVPVVDLPPVLNGHADYFDDQVHYSALGAKKVAGAISGVVFGVARGTTAATATTQRRRAETQSGSQ